MSKMGITDQQHEEKEKEQQDYQKQNVVRIS